MALIPILRNAGATIIRTPLLWFFSVVVLSSNEFLQIVQGDSRRLGCLTFLLIPITLLGYAGQIRSVQLHQEGTPTSVSDVIRYCSQKMRKLLGVYLVTLLLTLPLWCILYFYTTSPLQDVINRNPWYSMLHITGQIIYAMMIFALCAIVMSDLSLNAGLRTFFRAIRKDAFTILILVAIFSGSHYFIGIYSLSRAAGDKIHFAVQMLALLILEAVQSAVFVFAYLHYSKKAAIRVSIAKPRRTTPMIRVKGRPKGL